MFCHDADVADLTETSAVFTIGVWVSDPQQALKTAAWLRELQLQSAYGYESDFPAALEFAKTLKPGRLIDRGWPLRSHKKAIEHAPKAARAGHAKTVFEIAA